MSRQFWISSGHHLLDHDAAGFLVATPEFWRVYLARPEIVPPGDACCDMVYPEPKCRVTWVVAAARGSSFRFLLVRVDPERVFVLQ